MSCSSCRFDQTINRSIDRYCHAIRSIGPIIHIHPIQSTPRTHPIHPPNSYPRLLFLLEHFDEAFALLSLLFERHYLGKNDALLAESLYGFRRARYPAAAAANDPDGSSSSSNGGKGGMGPLTAADRRWALALTVLSPYAKAKLDALFNKWSAALPPPRRSSRRGQGHHQQQQQLLPPEEEEEAVGIRLRRAFVAMYPLLHATYEGSFFVYQWAYLLGRTKHYSPLLHLAGQALRRITREDLVRLCVWVALDECHACMHACHAMHGLFSSYVDLIPSSPPQTKPHQEPASGAAAPTASSALGARFVRSVKVALVLAVIAFKVCCCCSLSLSVSFFLWLVCRHEESCGWACLPRCARRPDPPNTYIHACTHA